MFGLLALFIGPAVVLPPAVSHGSWSEINRAAATSLLLPAAVLTVAFALMRLADRR